ncbi:MAG TPA: P1 family peptidase [Bauldia sp.]|nr:P1 family peptidase [Bauldia sp.]
MARNLITDVQGILVGNAADVRLKSGVTVLLCEEPAVASISIAGGAPGTRETDLLEPDRTVAAIDAIVLSGGSAFGLDAASGAVAGLAAMGRGFAVGPARVPIVPSAILFDLANGGDKNWGGANPYAGLGASALAAASTGFALGSAGAGAGATTASLKGGLGSTSAIVNGFTVGALVAVNAVGDATVAGGPHFWAAPFEVGGEFGGLGLPSPFPPDAAALRHKANAAQGGNTTIAMVATDAILTKAEAKRMAVMAQDGVARAIWPAHTPFDGDTVFAVATGRRPLTAGAIDLTAIGAVASACLARAVARAIHEATPAPGDLVPTWRERFAAAAR